MDLILFEKGLKLLSNQIGNFIIIFSDLIQVFEFVRQNYSIIMFELEDELVCKKIALK